LIDFLQIGVGALPLAAAYDVLRASSTAVRIKGVILAVVGALLYLLLYQPMMSVGLGIVDADTAQILIATRNLIAPRIENPTLGVIWSLLLVANVVLVFTGTRIQEFTVGKRVLRIAFWIISVYLTFEAFLSVGGWGLLLLLITSLVAALESGYTHVEHL
jgi:hypothetical protein